MNFETLIKQCNKAEYFQNETEKGVSKIIVEIYPYDQDKMYSEFHYLYHAEFVRCNWEEMFYRNPIDYYVDRLVRKYRLNDFSKKNRLNEMILRSIEFEKSYGNNKLYVCLEETKEMFNHQFNINRDIY